MTTNDDEIPEPDRDAWYLDYGHPAFDPNRFAPGVELIHDARERVDDTTWDETVLAIVMTDTTHPDC